VAATNADLKEAQELGNFRRDLYYRLTAHRVHVPALRERPEDIPLLLKHFAAEAAESLGRSSPRIGSEVIRELSAYHFPGNVRELQSMVYDCVSRISGDTMTAACIRQYVVDEARPAGPSAARADTLWGQAESLPSLREAEEFLFREALRRANGNQSVAARMLGVSQSTLSRRMNRAEE
jgi:DNA-binding NtrC family response regulator